MRYLKFSALCLGLLWVFSLSTAAVAAPEGAAAGAAEPEDRLAIFFKAEAASVPDESWGSFEEPGPFPDEYEEEQYEGDNLDFYDEESPEVSFGETRLETSRECRIPIFAPVCSRFKARELPKLEQELRAKGGNPYLEISTSVHIIAFVGYASLTAKIKRISEYGQRELLYRTFNYELPRSSGLTFKAQPVDAVHILKGEADNLFYSVTELHLDKSCRNFEKACAAYADSMAADFDSEIINLSTKVMQTSAQANAEAGNNLENTENAENANEDLMLQSKAYQAITSKIEKISIGDNDFVVITSNIEQIIGSTKRHNLRSSNLKLSAGTDRTGTRTVTRVSFSDLFENPQLAAKLCADRIKKIFAPYKMPALNLVAAAVTADPRNFRLRPDSIELILPANTVAPPARGTFGDQVPDNTPEIVTICIEDLQSAVVKPNWFLTPRERQPQSEQAQLPQPQLQQRQQPQLQQSAPKRAGHMSPPPQSGPGGSPKSCKVRVENQEMARFMRLNGLHPHRPGDAHQGRD